MRKSLGLFLFAVSAPLLSQVSPASSSASKEPATLPSIAERTAGMKHMDGYLPLDWDAQSGRLYLEIPHLGTDMILVDSLPYGTGSNDLGLDRGQLGRTRLVRFERQGPKVLLIEPNEHMRSSSDQPAQQLAVRQSFPDSVLFGLNVAAQSPDGASVLVDATEMFVRDIHEVAATLASAKQGAYHVDASRSTIVLEDTKDFPRNTEVEAELTFVTDGPADGQYVNDVTPDAKAMTVQERQSFIQLPEPGYVPRHFDPRSGYNEFAYRDYTAPLGEPLQQQFIPRHRLIKRDPKCTHACEAVEPIQYYVDRGAPEPIRTALLEGARWWDQAFQAAGWAAGTFRVDLLPEGADPMDIRYNIIQWVHRYTRGWSYGYSVADPRTGEIIKGNVTLGSLRARQDYLIATALLAPYRAGRKGEIPASAGDPMLQMVLQRMRTLAAHETGHTLGLVHNYIDSSLPHSPEHPISVMEYPHPLVTIDANGVPDLSHAYQANIGDWDKVTIDYGYREFDRDGKRVEDPAALYQILQQAWKSGLAFITDEDARPLGSAQPHAHLWDNGADPAVELDRVLRVRQAALNRFGEDAIQPGQPLSELEDTLVPLYLFHRYQTEAAAKEIGGLDYRYSLRGDGQIKPTLVDAADQRKALAAVLQTLSPETLTLPEPLLNLLPPTPPGFPRNRESFPSQTGLTFDPVAAAQSAADLTLALLFNPERASRLVQYHARQPTLPSLGEVIDATLASTQTTQTGLAVVVQHAVNARLVEALLGLAANPEASAEASAIAGAKARALKSRLDPGKPEEQAEITRIEAWEREPAKFTPVKPLEVPMGMPIGGDDGEF